MLIEASSEIAARGFLASPNSARIPEIDTVTEDANDN